MTLYEKIVVAVAMAIGIGGPVLITAFAPADPGWHVIEAVLLGMAVATLAYHFLGGVSDAAFNTPIVKLGGAAALLIGTTWLTYGWLKEGGTAAAAVQKAIDKARGPDNGVIKGLETQLGQANETIVSLRKTIADKNPNSEDVLVARIEAAAPGDALAARILGLEKRRAGPWTEIIGKPAKVQISFAGVEILRSKEQDGKKLRFTACPSLNLAGSTQRFTLDESEGGEGDSVDAEWAGQMAASYCEKGDYNRIQLSCAAAQKMAPKLVASCTDRADVLWRAGASPKRFSGIAERRNEGVSD